MEDEKILYSFGAIGGGKSNQMDLKRLHHAKGQEKVKLHEKILGREIL